MKKVFLVRLFSRFSRIKLKRLKNSLKPYLGDNFPAIYIFGELSFKRMGP